MTYSGIFKSHYPVLTGKGWIKTISAEDRQVFLSIGNEANDHGRLGGKQRARTAKRDERGRFK